MIAHQVKKGLPGDEFASAEDGVAVTAGFALGDEAYAVAEDSAGGGVGGFVARADHHAELLDTGGGGLLENDLEGGFRFALLVDQHLEGQGALAGIGSGDEGFSDFHGTGMGKGEPPSDIDPRLEQRHGQTETIRKVDQRALGRISALGGERGLVG
jgi:hypothetical protein